MSSLRDYQTTFLDLGFFFCADFELQLLGQVPRYSAAESCRKVTHKKMSPKYRDPL